MAIVLNPLSRTDEWAAELAELLPDDELRWYPEIGDPADAEFVIAWVMSRSVLSEMSNLRAILSVGAGAEQWLKPGMPDVPVVRLADPAMAAEMAAYVLSYVVRHQRGFVEAERAQSRRMWKIPDSRQTWSHRVGVLGFGEIGSRIGAALIDLGYPLNSWTRTRRETPGARNFAGIDELGQFLAVSDVVVNVLPSTAQTSGLLTEDRLRGCADGALFINVGRGTVLASEDALVRVLDDGPLSAAVLDVTHPEPPADDSSLWQHPQVTLTPHLSGITQVRSAAQLVARNINAIRRGDAASPLLDRSRGY